MAEEKTYLELSSETGSAHKFYEVTVEGTRVLITYGRIGTEGQKQETEYPTAEKAQAEANKKIKEKMSKGYEKAERGVRKKRPLTRRQIQSKQSTARSAPVLWKFETQRAAFGIFIDDANCWVGNEEGRIFALGHDGAFKREYKLPDGVKCIVSDGDWLYAGCDDGNVYDLTGKLPFIAYKIENNVDIFWLDIADAVLGVSDKDGNVYVFNHEDETQWNKKSTGSHGWMIRCDEIGVYHGHSTGITMYDWEDGSQLWSQKTTGAVLFGWQDDATVYAGTSLKKVVRYSKKGELIKEYQCDSAVYSCAASDDGRFIFAGDDSSSIYCFNAEGERLWKLATGCGSAFSMQFHKNCLYIVTTTGALTCIDATEAAITAAQGGTVPEIRNIKAPKEGNAAIPVSSLETTNDTSGGVVVQCIKEAGKLKIHVLSEGYKKDWHVQFPKDIREEGCRYVVEEIRESHRGGFYRAFGNIRKLTG